MEKMTIEDKILYLSGLKEAIKEINDHIAFMEKYENTDTLDGKTKACKDAIAAIEKLAEVF